MLCLISFPPQLQETVSTHHPLCAVMVWIWLQCVPQGSCVGGLVLHMMVLGGGGTFKRWSVVGVGLVIGDAALRQKRVREFLGPCCCHKSELLQKNKTGSFPLSGFLSCHLMSPSHRYSCHCDAICHELITGAAAGVMPLNLQNWRKTNLFSLYVTQLQQKTD
jgi:hypothetical protein